MENVAVTREEIYTRLVKTFLSETDAVVEGKGFGSSALKVKGKIFAMLTRDKLVVKLPQARVTALVEAGAGERFDPGHGRLMKEWISLEATDETEWLAFAREAMAFVAAN